MDQVAAHPSLLIALATYNEAGNITQLVGDLRHHLPDAHILVTDDNSPDGTGDLVSSIAESDEHVTLIRRSGKLGLGSAQIAALQFASDREFEFAMTMDADLSHRPEDAPVLFQAACQRSADLVIGSRYTVGGKIVGWSLWRRALSASANFLIRHVLGVRVKDCTAGFRAYDLKFFRQIPAADLRANGFGVITELLHLFSTRGAVITEVPVTFVDRIHGKTKITWKELAQSLLILVRLRLTPR